MAKDLVIGYGNADRQDDGVAWHVLASLARSLGRSVPLEAGDEFTPSSGEPELLFVPQLTPEMAEDIAAYQRVCYIDAHTGEIDQEVRLLEIRPDFQAAPFTHHMTPQTLLLVAQKLYTVQIQGWLLSVHGYEFGFARDLSPQTEVLVPRAVDYLRNWLDHPE